MRGPRDLLRYAAAIVVIAAIGIGSVVYVVANQGQGVPGPWGDTYDVKVELAAADGVKPGIGQPVNVAGVEVGSIAGAEFSAEGNAVLTLEIERGQLPRVHANATASLEPITPLKDMRLELNPGRPPAPIMADDETIGGERTSTPVPLDNLLSALDADTRAFLTALIDSLDRGTSGRGESMRRMLRALGPTTDQVGRISKALARRRDALAGLVHNLAIVTRAASRDEELADVVAAGNQTLEELAAQDRPLRSAIAKLPGALRTTSETLGNAARFSDRLEPTLSDLLPAVEDLPATLERFRPFARLATATLADEVRPLVREAQPLVSDLGDATPRLSALAPDMASSLQALNYLLNELAYNPPGNDEGLLYWLGWFGHNWASITTLGDANGAIGRAMLTVPCQQGPIAYREIERLFRSLLSLPLACPGS